MSKEHRLVLKACLVKLKQNLDTDDMVAEHLFSKEIIRQPLRRKLSDRSVHREERVSPWTSLLVCWNSVILLGLQRSHLPEPSRETCPLLLLNEASMSELYVMCKYDMCTFKFGLCTFRRAWLWEQFKLVSCGYNLVKVCRQPSMQQCSPGSCSILCAIIEFPCSLCAICNTYTHKREV